MSEKPVTAHITALFLSSGRGTPRSEISEGFFKINHGLEGDSYSGPGDRQVTLFNLEIRKKVQQDTRDGLCFPRFQETLQISGILLSKLSVGTRLQIGETLLEISVLGKKCYPECSIRKENQVCDLPANAAFARVIAEGLIRKGDSVSIF